VAAVRADGDGAGSGGGLCGPGGRVGPARVGVLGLYRDRPGPLSGEQFDVVLLYADVVLLLALDQRGRLAPGAADLLEPGFTGRRAEIHQAAGMVSVQLGVSVTDALAVLRARAYAEGRTTAQVAADVVTRRLSFTPPEFSLPGSGAPIPKRPAAPADDLPPPGNEQAEDADREGGE